MRALGALDLGSIIYESNIYVYKENSVDSLLSQTVQISLRRIRLVITKTLLRVLYKLVFHEMGHDRAHTYPPSQA